MDIHSALNSKQPLLTGRDSHHRSHQFSSHTFCVAAKRLQLARPQVQPPKAAEQCMKADSKCELGPTAYS